MRGPHAARSSRSAIAPTARWWVVPLPVIGVALTLVVATMAAAAPGPTFRSKLFNGATVDAAYDVTVGDVNGDGRPDVVTADYSPDSGISVELNEGHGDFKLRSYSLPTPAQSVVLAQLDGNGKPDLVVAVERDGSEVPNGVSVFINKGGGVFRRGPDTLLAPATFGAVGDVNGDGRADLVAVDANGDAVSLFLNRGAGGFDPGTAHYPTGRGVSSVATGDVNGDGKIDVATANSRDNSLTVLLNRGGGLEPKQDYRTGSEPVAIAVRDLNGDGKLDLATANFKATVSVLVNGGDEHFKARRDYRTLGHPNALVIGDLTGDQKPDIAVQSYSVENVSVLVNSGGGFRPKLSYRYQFEGGSLALADLNGDRRRDVVMLVHNSRNGDNWLAVLVNTPGVCNVQRLGGMTLLKARRTLARVNCRAGRVRRVRSNAKPGLVWSQKPAFGTVLPGGAKVDLVISRGPRG